MNNKPLFPLKYKFTLIIFALFIFTWGIVVSYFIYVFTSDKAAYIYDDVLIETNFRKTLINLELKNAYESLSFASLVSNPQLTDYNGIAELAKYQLIGDELVLKFQKFNDVEFVHRGLNSNYGEILNSKYKYDVVNFFHHPETIDGVFDDENLPHLVIAKMLDDQLIVARIFADSIFNITDASNRYTTYLLTSYGEPFLNVTSDFLKSRPKLKSEITKFKSKGISDSDAIIAFAHLDNYPFIIVTEVPKSIAFLARDHLVNQSIYLAIAVLCLACVTGFGLASVLTNNLNKLMRMASNINVDNFDFSCDIKSNDEVGLLADDFQVMSSKIQQQVEQIKDKVRLESDVEIAHQVQDFFIPQANVNTALYDMSSIYQAAARCGGDWWSYIDTPNDLYIFIGDATGHGVSAALLTATAHSVATSMRYKILHNPSSKYSPAQIAKFMNHAILSMGGKIHMTAFIGVYHKADHQLAYVNASHPMPYLISKKEHGSYSKKDIEVMMGAIGPRLGSYVGDYEYIETIHEIKNADTLFLFTDGVFENQNKNGHQFGQRNTLRSILKNINESPRVITEALREELEQYTQGVELMDDVTFITLRFKEHKSESIAIEDLQVGVEYDYQNLFAISNQTNEELFLNILNRFPLRHIIGANTKYRELEENLNLLEIIGACSTRRSAELYSSKDIDNKIQLLLSTLDTSKLISDAQKIIGLISDELLNNAFHSSKESDRLRTDEITVSTPILFSLIAGENALMIEVTDPYGTLEYGRCIESIARGFKEKTPVGNTKGAGLGLYTALNFSNQMIIQVQKNIETKVSCIIENNVRYKDFKQRIGSFQFIEME